MPTPDQPIRGDAAMRGLDGGWGIGRSQRPVRLRNHVRIRGIRADEPNRVRARIVPFCGSGLHLGATRDTGD